MVTTQYLYSLVIYKVIVDQGNTPYFKIYALIPFSNKSQSRKIYLGLVEYIK